MMMEALMLYSILFTSPNSQMERDYYYYNIHSCQCYYATNNTITYFIKYCVRYIIHYWVRHCSLPHSQTYPPINQLITLSSYIKANPIKNQNLPSPLSLLETRALLFFFIFLVLKITCSSTFSYYLNRVCY